MVKNHFSRKVLEVCEMTVIQHWCVIPENTSTHRKLERNLQDVGPMIFICTKTSAGVLCPDSSYHAPRDIWANGRNPREEWQNGQKSVRHGRHGRQGENDNLKKRRWWEIGKKTGKTL